MRTFHSLFTVAGKTDDLVAGKHSYEKYFI